MAEEYSGITQSCGHQSQRNKTGGEGRGGERGRPKEIVARRERELGKFKDTERKVT